MLSTELGTAIGINLTPTDAKTPSASDVLSSIVMTEVPKINKKKANA